MGDNKSKPKPHPPKKLTKTIEFRVYSFSDCYAGDLELLTTLTLPLKDVFDDRGRPLCLCSKTCEEYVRNIGMYGITIEDPEARFNYYPPSRIAKVEYNEI